MRLSHHTHLVYFLALILALVFAGCVSKTKHVVVDDARPVVATPVEAEVEQPGIQYEAGDEAYPDGYYVHTVSVPNENISVIAKWYTDEPKNWLVLAKCNPTIKPNRIFLGDKIKIPRSIMTRHKPLPAEFVQKSRSESQQRRKKKISQTKTTTIPQKPVEEEGPLLFGPKGF